MKKVEFDSTQNILRIDPFFLKEGIEYAFKNSIEKISLYPLNHIIDEEGIDYPKNLVFKLNGGLLKNAQFIKELSISDYVKSDLDGINSLYCLHNLKSLSFQDSSFKIDFSKIPTLENLYFKYNNGVKSIGTLKNLLELLIISFNETNLESLHNLHNLEILRLTRGTFTSLKGIEDLKKIKQLELAYASKLEDILQISSLPNLSKLHIEKCKCLDDFSFLSGNETIEELFIDNVKSLDFVPTMRRLKKINIWNCADGNMSPLLNSKSLEQINFYPNKKHYTHTIEEIIGKTGLKRGRHV